MTLGHLYLYDDDTSEILEFRGEIFGAKKSTVGEIGLFHRLFFLT